MALTQKTFSRLWMVAVEELHLSRKQAADLAGSYSTADRYTKGTSMPKPGARRQLERSMGLPRNYFEGTATVDWNAVRALHAPVLPAARGTVTPEAAGRLIGELLTSYERQGIMQVSLGQAREWLRLAGINIPNEPGAGPDGMASAEG